MNVSLIWWGLGIYIVISLFIAFLSRTGKQTNMGAYFLGDRKLGGFCFRIKLQRYNIQRIYAGRLSRAYLSWRSWRAWF